ncbi:unnamed protein product, partial [marine sediment metagenome]
NYCQDIAIYYSYNSNFDNNTNRLNTADIRWDFDPFSIEQSMDSHKKAAENLGKILLYLNIPFGVITKSDLKELFKYQIIMLPNVMVLEAEEVDTLKAYVSQGGNLYASKNTSLISIDGAKQKNFMLSDLFGVSYLGETEEIVTYISPKETHAYIFEQYSPQMPVTLYGTQTLVKPEKV